MRSAPHGHAATGDHWCSRIHNEFWWWSRAKKRSRNRDCLCRMQGVEPQIMDRVERCRDMLRVSGNCAGGNTRRQKGLHCSLIMRERRERFCPYFETRRLDTCPQSPRQRREERGEGGGGDGDGASPRDCPSLAFPFSIFLWGRKGERAQGKPRQDSGTPHGLAKNRRSGAGLWTCLQKPRSARVACGDHTCNSNHRSVSMDLSTSYMYSHFAGRHSVLQKYPGNGNDTINVLFAIFNEGVSPCFLCVCACVSQHRDRVQSLAPSSNRIGY